MRINWRGLFGGSGESGDKPFEERSTEIFIGGVAVKITDDYDMITISAARSERAENALKVIQYDLKLEIMQAIQDHIRPDYQLKINKLGTVLKGNLTSEKKNVSYDLVVARCNELAKQHTTAAGLKTHIEIVEGIKTGKMEIFEDSFDQQKRKKEEAKAQLNEAIRETTDTFEAAKKFIKEDLKIEMTLENEKKLQTKMAQAHMKSKGRG